MRVKEINTAGSSGPVYLATLGNVLLFSASDGQGSALWKSDGSDAGTTFVKDTARTASGIDDASYSYPSLSSGSVGVGGKLFFVPDDGVVHGQDLWVSDSTAAGTMLVEHINAGAVNPYSLTEHNNRLFFIGKDATATSLWQSDGTTAGTTIVQSFAGDTLGFDGHNLISAGNALPQEPCNSRILRRVQAHRIQSRSQPPDRAAFSSRMMAALALSFGRWIARFLM